MTDPEINAALAEKAMGWKKVCVGSFPPDYLTDPVASHALKEVMRTKGWLYESEDYRRSEGGLSHISRWRRPDEHPSMFAANDPSELRAVALRLPRIRSRRSMTRLLLALAAITLMAQQPRPDGVSCTVETITAPHGVSQHSPMVSGQSYREEVVIDPGVCFCVDGVGVTHATAVRPRGERCK